MVAATVLSSFSAELPGVDGPVCLVIHLLKGCRVVSSFGLLGIKLL